MTEFNLFCINETIENNNNYKYWNDILNENWYPY